MVGGLRGPVKPSGLKLELASLAGASAWESWLSPAESARAAGMGHPLLRARFVVSRGLRRKVLSELAGQDPAVLRFIEAAGEKPRCQAGAGWDFNLSHAGDYVALATGRGAVGVDLELIRPVRHMAGLVERYFHPDEAAAWRSVAAARQEEAFFVLWSAREAAMKCAGLGLARGLALTRIDPAMLGGGGGSGTVGSRQLVLHRADAPDGYVLVTAQEAF
jgi:4'-phosphopantetheinyl transferase